MSKIGKIGKHTYGEKNISIKHWGEDAKSNLRRCKNKLYVAESNLESGNRHRNNSALVVIELERRRHERHLISLLKNRHK